MLTIDRWQYIGGAITSVLKQKWEIWELIIIHDGENLQVKRQIEKWVAQDSRIRYYWRPKIGNIANAINYAIDRCLGEFVAILDDDDAWTNDRKLDMQVKKLRSNPLLLAIGGGAYVVDATGKTKMVYYRSTDPRLCCRYGLLVNPIIHSTVLMRRSILKKVGGYDESLSGYQDWDLWLRIMRIGQVSNIASCFASYRVWDGGGSSSKIRDNACSALRIVWRHRNYSFFIPSVCVSLSLLVISIVPISVRIPVYQLATKLKKRLKIK